LLANALGQTLQQWASTGFARPRPAARRLLQVHRQRPFCGVENDAFPAEAGPTDQTTLWDRL